ncbi:hypothetical protein FH972_026491 [Carpinus fangiana]|uniref:Uncharacterized protein n=1 Tax=Carpinus fangiana TaxID=176857 RepID=A0A5N6L4H8_9ROSI|nr:hypothetical protein FH972_026491 [Carpinus fangiana]
MGAEDVGSPRTRNPLQLNIAQAGNHTSLKATNPAQLAWSGQLCSSTEFIRIDCYRLYTCFRDYIVCHPSLPHLERLDASLEHQPRKRGRRCSGEDAECGNLAHTEIPEGREPVAQRGEHQDGAFLAGARRGGRAGNLIREQRYGHVSLAPVRTLLPRSMSMMGGPTLSSRSSCCCPAALDLYVSDAVARRRSAGRTLDEPSRMCPGTARAKRVADVRYSSEGVMVRLPSWMVDMVYDAGGRRAWE